MKKKLFISTIILSCKLFANNFSSMQGYTGFMNIPSPYVLQYGFVEFSYSNQVSINRRINLKNRNNHTADDYFFNIGLLPSLEITGRLSEIPNVMRDLSASFKVALPTKKFYKNLPELALGIQDLGGQTGDYKSKYIVFGDRYKNLSYSLGYGFDSFRLNGAFYGIEYKYNPYLYFLAENDSKENHLGVRFSSDKYFKNKQLSLLIKKNLSISHKDYSLLVNFKINLNKQNENNYKSIKNVICYKSDINDLKNDLKNLGLENISLYSTDNSIFISYENQVFNHNEIDAFNAVLKILYKYSSYDTFNITIKKENINIVNITGNLDKFRQYIQNQTEEKKKNFTNSLKLNYNFLNEDKYYIKNYNPSNFKTRLSFSPRLLTFIGTEYGTLDYFLGLETRIIMNIYKGLTFSALYRSPLIYSDDFDPKTGAFRSSYENSRLQNLLIHYTFSYKNYLNSTTIGKYYKNYNTIINENAIFYKRHNIKYKFAKFIYRKNHNIKKNINLLTYEYDYTKLDLGIEIVYGKFFNQDKGYKIRLKKFFDNTLIYLFYGKTKPKYNIRFSENINKFAGIGFEIPIVSKQISNNSRYFQLTSTNFFNYGIGTTVGRKDGTNTIVYGQLIEPKSYTDISRYFYNKNRLSLEYIKYNIE